MVPTNMFAFSLSENDAEAPPAPPPLRADAEPPSVPSRTHGNLFQHHHPQAGQTSERLEICVWSTRYMSTSKAYGCIAVTVFVEVAWLWLTNTVALS